MKWMASRRGPRSSQEKAIWDPFHLTWVSTKWLDIHDRHFSSSLLFHNKAPQNLVTWNYLLYLMVIWFYWIQLSSFYLVFLMQFSQGSAGVAVIQIPNWAGMKAYRGLTGLNIHMTGSWYCSSAKASTEILPRGLGVSQHGSQVLKGRVPKVSIPRGWRGSCQSN